MFSPVATKTLRRSVATDTTRTIESNDEGLKGANNSAGDEGGKPKPFRGDHDAFEATTRTSPSPATKLPNLTKRFPSPVVHQKYIPMSHREKKCLDRRLAVDEAMQGLGLSYEDAVILVARLDEELKMDLATFIANTRAARLRARSGKGKGTGKKGQARVDATGGPGTLRLEDDVNFEEKTVGGKGEDGEGEGEYWRLACE
ncbi:hypothetical protein HDK64DRAFT_254148 [Phyllosticta capitalensis]